MPFGPNDSNIKLKTNQTAEAAGVTSAIQQVNPEGKEYSFSGDLLPFVRDIRKGHLQGVAIQDNHAIITGSMKGGFIALFKGEGKEFSLLTLRSVQGYKHAGGVQTIGSYFVVPVEDEETSEIRFYTHDENIEYEERLTLKRDKQAGAVGITNCTVGDNEFYILAVCGNREIDFYRSKSNIPLSDDSFSFDPKPFYTWNKEMITKKHREDWVPDKKWRKYSNSISLIADDSGNVYLIGLRRSGFMPFFLGKDYVEVYHLNLNELEEKKLKKIAQFHVTCKNGTSFRWGGSALVTRDNKIKLYACERNVKRKGKKRIRVNCLNGN